MHQKRTLTRSMYLAPKDNDNNTESSMWDGAKVGLESFMALTVYVRTEESLKNSKRNVHFPIIKQI